MNETIESILLMATLGSLLAIFVEIVTSDNTYMAGNIGIGYTIFMAITLLFIKYYHVFRGRI